MSLLRRISNLFSRSKVDREIEAELRAHAAAVFSVLEAMLLRPLPFSHQERWCIHI